MPRRRFRVQILLNTSAIIVVLLGAMLLYVNWQAQRFVNDNIGTQFEQGRQRIQVIASERVNGLRLTAQLVASYPALSAMLLNTDAATIREFLKDYKRENPRGELLIVFDPSGRELGRFGLADHAQIDDVVRKWLQPALANGASVGVLVTEFGVFDAVAVPIAPTGTLYGFVLAGAPLNATYAEYLNTASKEDVVLAGPGAMLGTSIKKQLPWRTAQDWQLMREAEGEIQTAEVEGESYAALPFWLGEGENRVLAVILQSRDAALAPYRRIQLGLGVVGLIVMAVGVAASVRMAGSVTADIPKLVEGTARVAAGNFDQPIEVRSTNEIGDLAQAFNAMMRGLRERADMQKFVSQSTIEMIQSDSAAEQSLGRRVELTVFFSDIRGFTELSEKRPPEDVVTLLNTCLSLQADIVHKYDGDIDKYVGDCVVALFFGEQSAMSATQCAIEIEKALVQFNSGLPAADRLEIGIGIVTGEAVLGSIGSADRRDFTAIGSTVNLCSRLCSMAGPREILMAESSYHHVREQISAERLEPLAVRGFSQPIPVYRISYQAQPVPAV